MRSHSVARALVTATVASLALAPLAVALEQAGGARVTASIDALSGNQGIRTDPATVQDVGYVHPTQIDTGAQGGDFVAVGTANGLGVSQCADDYDPRWTIYADGETGGIYWCADYTQDAFGAGANPTFAIVYQICPVGSGIARWALKFNGTLWRCQSQGTSSGAVAAVFLETTGVGTVDRNIDVKYTNLKISLTGSAAYVNFDANAVVGPSPNYTVQFVNATSLNAYLAPLD